MNKISREALLGMARVADCYRDECGFTECDLDALGRFAELVLAEQQPVEGVPASAYRDAADTIEQIKWNSQHCECHAFEIANGWINETNGGTMFDDPSQQQAEPVAWQFFQDGKWWNGSEDIKDHRKNTENAGIPTRDLYPPPAVATRAAIRRVFMAHGFTVKEGHNDLKPYVFEAAGALLRELSPAVAIPAGYKLVPVEAVKEGVYGRWNRDEFLEWVGEGEDIVLHLCEIIVKLESMNAPEDIQKYFVGHSMELWWPEEVRNTLDDF